ncbi:DUF5996 family protein [Paeniglutamicibacter kerguelensis]|uniref:Ava_C0101 and related proteins n=1 Tax=Paeniglutamicibacter kerguelensis TaxID=254788 RepID=A0ABS4XAM3_9MICC|nr:DUF5996 family protein [Paeniglutamicibacter kerguelensis]MBP2385514.1 hypothetical protein [Paeniglutamicibacter kerguelensis]
MEPSGPETELAGWPLLRLDEWAQTRDTLHLWTQVVGKIRMAHAPMLNHWWQVPLYLSPRGLTTSSIPHPRGAFDIEFDFCDHQLRIRAANGTGQTIPLRPMPTAGFHAEVFEALDRLGLDTAIRPTPVEVEPAVPFAEDHQHASYDPAAARLFWRQLLQADRVMNRFRSHFSGKASPVHFFWGAMDLVCTRFSGRTAPRHPGGAPNCADWVMVEAYSHEVSSCGFWPGGGEEGAFYSYAYPEPEGFSAHRLSIDGAFYSQELREFVLPYECVRGAKDPDGELMRFLQETYAAAAGPGNWDRARLETDPDRWLGLLP